MSVYRLLPPTWRDRFPLWEGPTPEWPDPFPPLKGGHDPNSEGLPVSHTHPHGSDEEEEDALRGEQSFEADADDGSVWRFTRFRDGRVEWQRVRGEPSSAEPRVNIDNGEGTVSVWNPETGDLVSTVGVRQSPEGELTLSNPPSGFDPASGAPLPGAGTVVPSNEISQLAQMFQTAHPSKTAQEALDWAFSQAFPTGGGGPARRDTGFRQNPDGSTSLVDMQTGEVIENFAGGQVPLTAFQQAQLGLEDRALNQRSIEHAQAFALEVQQFQTDSQFRGEQIRQGDENLQLLRDQLDEHERSNRSAEALATRSQIEVEQSNLRRHQIDLGNLAARGQELFAQVNIARSQISGDNADRLLQASEAALSRSMDLVAMGTQDQQFRLSQKAQLLSAIADAAQSPFDVVRQAALSLGGPQGISSALAGGETGLTAAGLAPLQEQLGLFNDLNRPAAALTSPLAQGLTQAGPVQQAPLPSLPSQMAFGPGGTLAGGGGGAGGTDPAASPSFGSLVTRHNANEFPGVPFGTRTSTVDGVTTFLLPGSSEWTTQEEAEAGISPEARARQDELDAQQREESLADLVPDAATGEAAPLPMPQTGPAFGSPVAFSDGSTGVNVDGTNFTVEQLQNALGLTTSPDALKNIIGASDVPDFAGGGRPPGGIAEVHDDEIVVGDFTVFNKAQLRATGMEHLLESAPEAQVGGIFGNFENTVGQSVGGLDLIQRLRQGLLKRFQQQGVPITATTGPIGVSAPGTPRSLLELAAGFQSSLGINPQAFQEEALRIRPPGLNGRGVVRRSA